MAQADPLAWYPGHCYLETALFGQGSAPNSSKLQLIDHNVHKRSFHNDETNDKTDISYSELCTSTNAIPEGSLQLIRFIGLARNAPELADIHQDRQVLASVFSTLGFPLAHAEFALNSPRIEHGRLFMGDDTDIESKNPAFYATGSRLCLIWRFETETKSTRVVVVNHTPSSYQFITGFIPALEASMQKFNQCFGHPMFIGIPFVHILRLDTISLYDQDSDILSAIENQVTLRSVNRVSTMQQLRDLGRLIGHDKFVLSGLRSFLEQARLWNERTYADKEGLLKDPTSKHFLAHLELQQDHLKLDMMFLEKMRENITHQQTAISMIVNMQDGTSMKTLAVITMVFLPGTFLASIFAMPVFPEGRHDAFWLYWAVCVPLTAIVLVGWLGWFYWHTGSGYYDDRQEVSPDHLKQWWQSIKDVKVLGSKNDSQDLIRRRLAGDMYKEWLDRFYSPKTKKSDSQFGAASQAQTERNKQSV